MNIHERNARVSSSRPAFCASANHRSLIFLAIFFCRGEEEGGTGGGREDIIAINQTAVSTVRRTESGQRAVASLSRRKLRRDYLRHRGFDLFAFGVGGAIRHRCDGNIGRAIFSFGWNFWKDAGPGITRARWNSGLRWWVPYMRNLDVAWQTTRFIGNTVSSC